MKDEDIQKVMRSIKNPYAIQNFPEGWQEGEVYVLTVVNEQGNAFDDSPVLAVSPDLVWVKDKKIPFDEARKQGHSIPEVGIFQMTAKSYDPIMTQNLRKLAHV